jgi:ribosomal protein S18 acetylase RimI-like enzyme
MRTRPAVLADAADIAAVHRLSRASYYGEAPDPEDDRAAMWAQLLTEASGDARLTWVVEDKGGVVGFLSVRRPPERAGTLELTAIYVRPENFGQGVGSRLYDVFVDARDGEEAGTLEVWAGNRQAIDFYRHRGWTATTSERPGPQGRPFVTYELAPPERGTT